MSKRPEGMPSADHRTPLVSGNAQYLGRTITDDMVSRNQQVIDGLREEVARLRELIPQAWQAGMECVDNHGPSLDQWMKSKGLE